LYNNLNYFDDDDDSNNSNNNNNNNKYALQTEVLKNIKCTVRCVSINTVQYVPTTCSMYVVEMNESDALRTHILPYGYRQVAAAIISIAPNEHFSRFRVNRGHIHLLNLTHFLIHTLKRTMTSFVCVLVSMVLLTSSTAHLSLTMNEDSLSYGEIPRINRRGTTPSRHDNSWCFKGLYDFDNCPGNAEFILSNSFIQYEVLQRLSGTYAKFINFS